MKTCAMDALDAVAILVDWMNGDVAVRLTGPFAPEDVSETRRIVVDHSDRDSLRATRFQGAAAADGTVSLQRRVSNLLAKGGVFARRTTHAARMTVRSDHDRTANPIPYLPRWMKQMENMPAALPAALIGGVSPALRQLLRFVYPCPEGLDPAAGGNAEGRA